MMPPCIKSIVLAGGLFTSVAVLAAPISWGPATAVSATSDVSTNGVRVEAFNAGATGVANQTVNGVLFTGTGALLPLNATSDSFSGNTGDTAYNALLSTIDYGGGRDETLSLGGGNLVDGEVYEVQVWFVDTRYNPARDQYFGDGDADNSNDAHLYSNPGQFAIGTFTADGTGSQDLEILSGDSDHGNVHINAYQIRTLGSIPAPNVPTGFGIRNGNNLAILGWDDNAQAGFKTFHIKRSSSSGGPYTEIGSGTSSEFFDHSVTNGSTYYYVITAENIDDIESAPCAEQEAMPSASTPPPNFLFIIADDMDTYAVNAYRETEPAETDASGNFYAIDTPNMDRLADEGMLFHQARLMGANSGAVCTPSRTTIMSGKSTWERTVGVTAATTFPGIFNRGVRSGDVDLQHATYRTCKAGNSYATANAEFTVVNDAVKRGNTDGNGSEWHGDWGVDYIEDWNTNHRTNETPFLMYLGFSHPHDERLARETPNLTGRYGCVNTTDPASIVLNANAPPLPLNHLSCTPATYPAHPFDHGGLGIRDENTAAGILQYRTEAVVRNEIGRNFACVDWIDQQMGRVFQRLEDPNGDGDTSDSIMDNTYIVFTSDHGIAIGRHGLQGKQNLYEPTWRVPYIVRGPGIAAGSETDALIYLHETFPTFCDLAGLDIPSTIDGNDGQSFRAVLEGTTNAHHDVIYGLYAGSDKPGIRSITDGRFKLIKYDVDSNGVQVTQLFDLQENPFELLPEHGVANLATQPAYALIRQQLEERLLEKRIEYADPYTFLGDRTLLRFENDLTDRFPFENDGTAPNGAAYSSDVPNPSDYVVGEANTDLWTWSRIFNNTHRFPHSSGLSFGDAPFTIEAWVKLETLPSTNDLASSMPLVQKKVIGAADSELDYMFIAAAGNVGPSETYSNMVLRLGSTVIVSSLAIPDTEWHHISVALDPVSDTVRFTLDDQIDEQTTTAVGTVNTGPLVIGAHFNGSSVIDNSFDGLIDELSITDGFLAPAELQPLQQIPEPAPFEMQSIAVASNTVSLTVESDSLYLYDLESKERLSDPDWELEQSFIQGETDSTQFDLPMAGTQTSKFYRVRTETYRKP